MTPIPGPERARPQHTPERGVPLSRPALAKWILAAAVAAGIATGIGWHLSGGGPATEPVLSAAAQAARVNAFDRSGTWTLPAPAGQAAQQAAATGLTGAPLADLVASIERGEARVVSLTLWDDRVEDGDVVAITSGGFQQEVPLAIAHRQVSVPVFTGKPVTMVGVRDGGGGITVAVDVAGAGVPLPVMSPGSAVTLPVGP